MNKNHILPSSRTKKRRIQKDLRRLRLSLRDAENVVLTKELTQNT